MPQMVPLLAQANAAETFITKLIDGLALGSIYAILALGLVIIFKSTQVLSFAHGAVAAWVLPGCLLRDRHQLAG